MSTSAFPFLDGRTTLEGAAPRTPRHGTNRSGVVLTHLRRRFRREDLRRGGGHHERRDTTDAYLDRNGLSSVDWTETLTRQIQR